MKSLSIVADKTITPALIMKCDLKFCKYETHIWASTPTTANKEYNMNISYENQENIPIPADIQLERKRNTISLLKSVINDMKAGDEFSLQVDGPKEPRICEKIEVNIEYYNSLKKLAKDSPLTIIEE